MGFFADMLASMEGHVSSNLSTQSPPELSSRTDLRCVIHAEYPIDMLAVARTAFAILPDYLPSKAKATKWHRARGDSYDLMVVAMGKTGYGKSTTLNTLLGEEAFATSDISGCTRKLQSVEYRFCAPDDHYYCSFADLPGLGEDRALDADYYPLYRDTLRCAQVVLYFVRADQRDYTVDQRAFKELVQASESGSKVILVLNAVDKIEPLSRVLPFAPSAQQNLALKEKIDVLSGVFGLPRSSIIPVSGTQGFNLDALASAIVRKLSNSLVSI
jgi:small GTP-binding protein